MVIVKPRLAHRFRLMAYFSLHVLRTTVVLSVLAATAIGAGNVALRQMPFLLVSAIHVAIISAAGPGFALALVLFLRLKQREMNMFKNFGLRLRHLVTAAYGLNTGLVGLLALINRIVASRIGL